MLTKVYEAEVTDQQWLEHAAFYWLDMDYVLRWDWNATSQEASGFAVIGEGGIQATITLADRTLR